MLAQEVILSMLSIMCCNTCLALSFLYQAEKAAAEETDDDEDDIKEEVLFESPLDDIDAYIKFQETLVGKCFLRVIT